MSDEEIPLTHRQAEARAVLFEQMAARIRLNKDAKFGGCFLVVPPGEGEPFSLILLDQEEAPIFWGALKGLYEVAMTLLEKAQRQQGFGR
jgi:hypothetical protein